MPRKPKSKPIYTFTLDSASDRFTFDYASNGIQGHAEGPLTKLMPQLRRMAAPLIASIAPHCQGLVDRAPEAPGSTPGHYPAAAPKKPAKKKTRRTVKTKKP
jgi:hypothetical protein